MKEQTHIQSKKSSPAKPSTEKKPCLIMIEGDYLGEIYALNQATCLIGRDDDADIVLADTGVSRRHAMIEKAVGGFTVSDLQSTNGTEVNGSTVQKTELKDNDKIRLGDTVLKFCFQDDIDNE